MYGCGGASASETPSRRTTGETGGNQRPASWYQPQTWARAWAKTRTKAATMMAKTTKTAAGTGVRARIRGEAGAATTTRRTRARIVVATATRERSAQSYCRRRQAAQRQTRYRHRFSKITREKTRVTSQRENFAIVSGPDQTPSHLKTIVTPTQGRSDMFDSGM